MKRAAGLLAALLAAPALFVSGCEGTSSGVDNPGVAELTVDFRDAKGAEISVSGDLDVFAKDQNPALYPEPLATVKVRNASHTVLYGEDFDRIRGKVDAPTKRSAASASVAAGKTGAATTAADGPFDFNVVFRGKSGIGTLAYGLSYDPKDRAFTLSGAGLARIVLRPGPVARYAARLQRAPVHGDLGRVFIPGSPFLSAFADSGFVLESLPEGVFDLRLLTGDGSIYAVKESLDTRVSRTYTASPEPLGHIDSSDIMARPVPFTVKAAGPPEAFVNTPAPFDARIVASEPMDHRASFRWRQIDSLTAPGLVRIKNPAVKGAEITFPAEGIYTLEASVTIGVTTMRDTLFQKVRTPPLPKPRIVYPHPNDSLVAGTSYMLSWEMPAAGAATVELSRSGGGADTWEMLVQDLQSGQGLSFLPWVPADSLAPSPACLLRVRLKVGDVLDSLVAVSDKPFALLPHGSVVSPPPPPPPAANPVDTLPKP